MLGQNKLAFLNVLVTKKDDRLVTSVYWKQTKQRGTRPSTHTTTGTPSLVCWEAYGIKHIVSMTLQRNNLQKTGEGGMFRSPVVTAIMLTRGNQRELFAWQSTDRPYRGVQPRTALQSTQQRPIIVLIGLK